MDQIFNFLQYIVESALLLITFVIFGTYIILAIVSGITLTKYMRKNSYVDYNSLILAPLMPSISIIAPAFNEEQNIIENIRALLSVYYNDYDVVIVNDGSTDGTLKSIIDAYDLEKVNYAFEYQIPCERIKAVYKSKNRSLTKLTVIDKVNGGKADSLNAGINVSRSKLIVSIDADSILEPDALLKMVKPFIEEKDKRVIGTGGVVRIVNSCEIEGGVIKEIHLPKNLLARIQVLEYTRAFLMTRMAWSRLDGLLLISGALGMFDKEIVIKCGGYDINTVGEDMELVVRMRRYMKENKRKYEVTYIPDPLCWTEVPTNYKILSRQRNRWTRGTVETLFKHLKVFLNPNYGRFGILGYPYWFFIEWLGPIIEFCGITYFIILAIMGKPNWSFFLLLLTFVYVLSVTMSIWSVLFEEMTYHKYEKKRDVLRLMGTAFFEPFVFHPFTVIWAIRANIDYFLLGKKGWGKMERKGFYSSASSKLKK